MKKLRLVLPAVAFIMAIVATIASAASYVETAAKGINGESGCQSDTLDGGRTVGTGTGQCNTVDDGNGQCTVTFGSSSATTAYTNGGTCQSSQIYYIGD